MNAFNAMSKCHWPRWLYCIRYKLFSSLYKLCICQINNSCISVNLRVGEGVVFGCAIGANAVVVKGDTTCVLDECGCVLYQGGR